MVAGEGWEDDSASAGGNTSIEVLLAWLGQHGNYDRWRGGAGVGESK
jgi:hypothetical protein